MAEIAASRSCLVFVFPISLSLCKHLDYDSNDESVFNINLSLITAKSGVINLVKCVAAEFKLLSNLAM